MAYIFKTKRYTISEQPIVATFNKRSKANKFLKSQEKAKSFVVESPKAIGEKKEDSFKTIKDEDIEENVDNGTFEVIESAGAGDNPDEQNVYIKGYYVLNGRKLLFNRNFTKDTFYIKGKISEDNKDAIKDKVDEKFEKLREFD